MAVYKVTGTTFDAEVLKSEQTTLVDFYADWCGPCKMLSPIVDEIAQEQTGVKICKLNVDDAPEIAAKYGVMSIPTLIVFKKGEVASKTLGLQSKQNVLNLLK
ncbi:MAG: thioredoxin [Clostridia bacterium]